MACAACSWTKSVFRSDPDRSRIFKIRLRVAWPPYKYTACANSFLPTIAPMLSKLATALMARSDVSFRVFKCLMMHGNSGLDNF